MFYRIFQLRRIEIFSLAFLSRVNSAFVARKEVLERGKNEESRRQKRDT